MGREAHLSCRTYRKSYYLGYGPYSTWVKAETLAEYEAADNSDYRKNLLKNENLYRCLKEHDGHDYAIWSSDYCDIIGDDLVEYMSDVVLIEGYTGYELFNLYDEDWFSQLTDCRLTICAFSGRISLICRRYG